MIRLIKKPKRLSVSTKSSAESMIDPINRTSLRLFLHDEMKRKLPKNTLRVTLFRSHDGCSGNDFVMNLITTIAIYKVYTFKRK